jgi:hypothetical protein
MSWLDLTDGVMRVATNTFGETVVFTPSGGLASNKLGIFRDQFLEIDSQTGYQVLTDQPNLSIRNSDFATLPVQGDNFTIRNVNYTVHTLHRDGEAGSTILLYKV